MGTAMTRCDWCGHDGATVPVHGHGQCARCGTNIEPCCSGANAADEAAATTGIAGGIDRALLARTFRALGGEMATVTGDALRFALAQRLGTDLDDAALLIEAAERVGQLQRTGPGCYRLR
jgi:hypothetical protein